jgi:hypothetical protein
MIDPESDAVRTWGRSPTVKQALWLIATSLEAALSPP